MRKTILAFLSALIAVGVATNLCFAAGLRDWEANIKVSSDNAKNRLSFGQKPEATDARDGLYDAPAMLAGKVQAYFLDGDGALWRDIRAPGTEQEWLLVITSSTGQPITIDWDHGYFPKDTGMELLDLDGNFLVDMQTADSYTFDPDSDFEVTIKFIPPE